MRIWYLDLSVLIGSWCTVLDYSIKLDYVFWARIISEAVWYCFWQNSNSVELRSKLQAHFLRRIDLRLVITQQVNNCSEKDLLFTLMNVE